MFWRLSLALLLCLAACDGKTSVAPCDSGTVVNEDAGSQDSGAPDSGTDQDSGTTEGDAGAPEEDAGPVDMDAGTPPADAGAPHFPACDSQATSQVISFLHVNDLHANYQPNDSGVSPYAIIRGAYLAAKATNPFTVFTSGGDEYEKGSVAEQLSQGRATQDVTFGMRFDARVIGNHDYAWDEEAALESSRDPYAIVLSTNVRYTGDQIEDFGGVKYAELQVGCVRIGFFGLTSGPWNELDQYTEANFYPDFPTDLDYVGRAQSIVNAHRGDVDLLVGITHIGEGRDEGLAQAVSGIDVLLGGHSHTEMPEEAVVNGTIIIQAGAWAEHFAQLDLTYDLAQHRISGHQYSLEAVEDSNATPDPEIAEVIEGVLDTYAPQARTPIGQLSVAQDAGGLGRLAAQAAVSELHTDAAVIDLSTVWGALPAGGVTQQQFLDSFKVERQPPGSPGFSALYTVSLDGASLRRVQSGLGNDSGWAGVWPTSIDDGATYRLALQKRTALHPDVFLPSGVTLTTAPLWQMETWQVLDLYARDRTAACAFMDADGSLPACAGTR